MQRILCLVAAAIGLTATLVSAAEPPSLYGELDVAHNNEIPYPIGITGYRSATLKSAVEKQWGVAP